VVTAEDGAAGLEAVRAHRPDLAILDVNMPLLDGRDVCRELKAREETREIPILFLSARADQFSRHLCLELGAEDFVEKPFDLDALMRKIRYLLGKRGTTSP
jgi:two-component system, OmpR family, phosphate regulon response regulator PhoB